MAQYSAGSAKVDISPDMSGFANEVRRQLEQTQVEYNVDVDADLARFRAEMDRLQSESPTIDVDVDLDTDDAEARLDALTRDRTVNVDVDAAGLSAVAGNADRANASLTRMSGIKFGALAAGIAALTPALLGVAGAAGGAAGALAAIGGTGLIGGSGLIDTFSALNEQTASAGQTAVDTAEEIESAQRGVRDALRDVEDAHRGVTDAENTALQAQRALNDSYEEATRYLRDMNDQLVDAQLAQERAEISLTQAQERRSEVYADPRRYNQTDRLSADLSVREAQQRLREAKSRTVDQSEDTADANRRGVGGSDIVTGAQDRAAEANRGVTDAQQRLTEANEKLAEAREELTKAGSAGAAGAGGVDKFAEAMAKLSPNAQDFVRKMQALGPAWTALRTAVQDRMFDGIGDSITQFANQNLAGLQSGLVSIAGFMNGTFQQTLLSLTDVFSRLTADGTMQQFINSIGQGLSGIAPLISGLTEGLIQMTAAMGPGMGALFTALGSLFTQIGPQLGQLGNTLALALASIGPTLGEFINAVATGLGPVLPVLATLINSLGQALIPLMPPLSQILQIIGTALAQALQAVAPFAANFAQALANILAAVAPLIPVALNLLTAVFTPLSGVLVQLTQTMAPVIEQLLNQLRPAIEQLAPVLSQVLVSMGQTWVGVMQQLLPILPQLVNSILQLVLAFVPLLPQVAQLAATFLPILVDILVRLSPVITAVIDALTWLVNNVIVPLLIPFINQSIQAITSMYGSFQRMWDIVSGVLTNLGNAVMSVKDTVVNRFNDMVNFVGGLPDRIKNAAAGMWDGIKDTFKGVLNWIIQAWNDFNISMTIPRSVPLIGGKGFSIDTPNLPLLKADGGAIRGPGGPKDDVIPALLSNGEYVVQASAVAKYGVGMFDSINASRFSDGGMVGTYGMPPGGGDDFPQWVRDLQAKYQVDPSTYAGHQEGEGSGGTAYGYQPNPQGLNRGIDWGGAVDALQRFAEYLHSIAASTPELEQIIWMNPNTGQKIGWAGRRDASGDDPYYVDDWGGHQNHVHTRFNGPIGAAPKPNPYAVNPNGTPGPDAMGAWSPEAQNQQEGRSDPQMYAPSAPAPGVAGSTPTQQKPYPTSFSGWAGFLAEQFVGSQVKDTLNVFGVNDSPGWLQAGTKIADEAEKNRQKQIQGGTAGPNGQSYAPGSTTAPPGSQTVPPTTVPPTAQTPPGSTAPEYLPVKPDPAPVIPPPTAGLVTNVPEGGIADGSPGAKQAVWEVWQGLGWTDNQWLDTLRLVNGESSWDESAANPSSTAQGLFQFLDTTRAQYGYGPTAREQAGPGSKYIKERYGDPSAAWAFWSSQSPHWYHDGGTVSGYGDIPSVLEGGEFVVNRHSARDNMPLLESINSRRPMPSVNRQPAMAGGSYHGDTINISTARVEDAFVQAQQIRDRRAAMGVNRWRG